MVVSVGVSLSQVHRAGTHGVFLPLFHLLFCLLVFTFHWLSGLEQPFPTGVFWRAWPCTFADEHCRVHGHTQWPKALRWRHYLWSCQCQVAR
ncbi:hypothetical protein BDZ88DRAFT_245256 [Geranomyces variabilis]|nr:hypothetical protein BDZ88DRAFT_245256 [Geranomyces variabilis]